MHREFDYDHGRLRHEEELKAAAEARLGRRPPKDRESNASRLSPTLKHFAGNNPRRHAT